MSLNVNTGHPRLTWGTRALWSALDPLLPGIAVEVMAQAESTNTLLSERARASAGSLRQRAADPAAGTAAELDGAPPAPRALDFQPCLLVAEQQLRGRGRMGRTWQSFVGSSLTFSLALPLAPVNWSGLSLAVGLCLAEALDPTEDGQPPRLRLKWPNDLMLDDAAAPMGGRKCGGILIETVQVGDKRMCIVGVGLNVRQLRVEDPSSGFACLQEIQPAATAPGTLARIAPPLVRCLQRFEAEGFAAFADRYATRDLLSGRHVHASVNEGLSGVAEGVDEQGGLRLLCDDGRRVTISSGEVSVRPAGSAHPGKSE